MRFAVLIIVVASFISPQSGRHSLTVTVTGLKPIKGDLYIALHNRPEYFQIADSAFMKTKIEVTAETEMVSFNNVPEGRYAIAVYHDENLNGMLDANEIGIPKEGYGLSNNNNGPGRPKFEKAAFDFRGNDAIEVKMIYHNSKESKKGSTDK